MFRISFIVCVSLIFGVAAKPYKTGNELPGEALQDTVMSIDDERKMSWEVEVEPPEDTDETHYDIDPNMMIWKSMTGRKQDKQPLKAEEDLDELNHPSMADILKARNLDVLSAFDIEAEPIQEETSMKYNEEPEEDRDDIDHPVFDKAAEEPDWDLGSYLLPLIAEGKTGAEVFVAHSEPEKDEDDLYHHEDQPSPVQMELLRPETRTEGEVRVHLQPEYDMDDLYHEDLLLFVPYQDDTADAVAVDLPSQRKHSEPEHDLDDLYHQ